MTIVPSVPRNRVHPGCPCGAAETYVACCGRYHRGEAVPPTAEALMRSRYSAFALHDPVYLIRTWHPSTRPSRLDLGRGRTWERLEVLGKSGGSLFDSEGQVRFRAHYVQDGNPGVQQENSRFVRESGEWLYVGAADIGGAAIHGSDIRRPHVDGRGESMSR